ncbi:MAG: ATP-binding protein [Gallionella sp.]
MNNKTLSNVEAPKWHLVYYALAGFDLIAILMSLAINVQVTSLYISAVETNQEWAQRLSQYSHLNLLATEVNRPGNDIFLTADVEAEQKNFDVALDNFNAQLFEVKVSNVTHDKRIDAALKRYMDSISLHIQEVEMSANKILALFETNPLLAGNEMARMDHSFFNLTESISYMSEFVQEIQSKDLAKQAEYAKSLDTYEKMIAGFILFMVTLVVFYGHFLSKKVTAFITAQRDANIQINELNRTLEQRVEERTAELYRSNQELEQFAYVASHDLREPLRKIQTFGDRIVTKEYNNLSQDGQSYLERMQNAAQRMDALIQGLLAYSRLGGHVSALDTVDLNKLTHGIVSDFESIITQSQATIEIAPLPTILSDPLLLTQLLRNLIGNALKFVKKDTKPHIKVSAEENNGTCILRVADNGIGIDPQYKEQIFGVFQRLHGRTEYEGTGIGLSICKKAIKQLNGTLTFKSALEKGTIFEIMLPNATITNDGAS